MNSLFHIREIPITKDKMKRLVSAIWIIWILVEVLFSTCYASHCLYLKDTIDKKPKKILCTIKIGQGGFNDSRSPIGKLGGGQIALVAQYYKYPIALSYSEEYYTNSANPTEPYEIFSMWTVHTNYSQYFFRKNRLNV
ncbi:MAG: hypothetical protein MI922_20485, partial [Bacteroidales bacterium]|nr:hypothetical protein [Bacteroidales bacterium]